MTISTGNDSKDTGNKSKTIFTTANIMYILYIILALSTMISSGKLFNDTARKNFAAMTLYAMFLLLSLGGFYILFAGTKKINRELKIVSFLLLVFAIVLLFMSLYLNKDNINTDNNKNLNSASYVTASLAFIIGISYLYILPISEL